MAQSLPNGPGTLYKYLQPERVNVLANARIRYSPLSAFNDPFEGRPELIALSPEAELTESIRRIVDEEAVRSYATFGEAFQASVPLETYLRWAHEMANAQGPQLRQSFQNMLPELQTRLRGPFESHIGTLSLSEKPADLLMWAHYAASHSGFVLEFNAYHPYFHQKRSNSDELRHIRQVQYRDQRPSVALTALNPTDLFLVKSSHWAYEQEWRILRAFDEATEVIQVNEKPIYLFAFPPEAVASVILGARASEATASAIKAILRSNSHYAHVKLQIAVPDESHFALRFVAGAL